MANLLQQAGAASEPTSFAPLHTNRIFTGLWTNRNPLRDAATSEYQERGGMGRQDSIIAGFNSEISPRLTLRRRWGTSVYNSNVIPPVKRFYSFNTFTLTDEVIHVMADTATTVYDATAPNLTPIFTKSAGAGSTYFLGVGNTLYFTNGVDNMQWNPMIQPTPFKWGIKGPTIAPTVSQSTRPWPYFAWKPSTVYAVQLGFVLANRQPDLTAASSFYLWVLDPNGNLQQSQVTGELTTGGPGQPAWQTVPGTPTPDGTVVWFCLGPAYRQPNTPYAVHDVRVNSVNTSTGIAPMLFVAQSAGTTSNTPSSNIAWGAGIGSFTQDGGVLWQNYGVALDWVNNIGPNTPVSISTPILDPNGYQQGIIQAGKTLPSPGPTWSTHTGDTTLDGSAVWRNTGPYSVAATAPMYYGYAFQDSQNKDVSNMSPKSVAITVITGNQITVQGEGSDNPEVDTIPIYRTAQGGSTFLLRATVPNPGAGNFWTFVDTDPSAAALDPLIQAQVLGEGTPLPAGATCLGYHLGRIFAAVGNVVYVSAGPDAIIAGASGNAGFNTTFTAQSKITRFWTCSLGLVVFTVRDAYIILGSATQNDPLYMVVFIEQIPLLSYDAFTVNKTTPMLLQGNNMAIALDPSAGIVEIGFPIADRLLDEFDPATSYVTHHSESSAENALYVANGVDHWYRMNMNNAPEQGSAWSTRANIAQMGCVQSVEVTPGKFRLLISSTVPGPILQRDKSKRTDNGATYAVRTVFGNIVLAHPGQLAALSFITLESVRAGTRAGLALLLGEISGKFDKLERTRQDPTNLPPSNTLYSDRYHFAQNQQTAWCRHFQMEITWPAEDAINELLTFTIFGQTWQEMRSQ